MDIHHLKEFGKGVHLMESYEEIDFKILETAKEIFAKQGIAKTEMKDIATKAGIGRSTLYRHFASKDSILFVIANRSLVKIMNCSNIEKDKKYKNGYEMVKCQLHSLMSGMIENVEDIIFLRDFDFIFTQDFPSVEEVSRFERYIQRTEGMTEMLKNFNIGIMDKSICKVDNPELTLLTMINGCFAMAQRILPREKHYIIELGYGREIMNRHLELMLIAIKAAV